MDALRMFSWSTMEPGPYSWPTAGNKRPGRNSRSASFGFSRDRQQGDNPVMRYSAIAALLAGIYIAADAAQSSMIPVTERNGAAYVSATELERSVGIAVKKLPGSDAIVACSEDRCARVKGFLRERDVTLVNVAELAKVLGLA